MKAISFSGIPQNFAIGFVDIVNSSNITAKLTYRKASMYYSTFLNSMSVVVNASGGKVVKNIGDSLMFYFKGEGDLSHRTNFTRILDCGINMIHARRTINEKLNQF